MKRIFLIIATIRLVGNMGFAKEPKLPDSYNLQRGIELIQSDQMDDGRGFTL